MKAVARLKQASGERCASLSLSLFRVSTGHRSRVHEHGEHDDRAEIYDVTRKSFRSLSASRAFRQFMGSRASSA